MGYFKLEPTFQILFTSLTDLWVLNTFDSNIIQHFDNVVTNYCNFNNFLNFLCNWGRCLQPAILFFLYLAAWRVRREGCGVHNTQDLSRSVVYIYTRKCIDRLSGVDRVPKLPPTWNSPPLDKIELAPRFNEYNIQKILIYL